jgi:hypothetical protein
VEKLFGKKLSLAKKFSKLPFIAHHVCALVLQDLMAAVKFFVRVKVTQVL